MSSRLLDTVFDIQIRYAIKLADVVRHKNHILRSGVRGIQHIQWFNRCSTALKIDTKLTVLGSYGRTKGKNAQRN